MGQDKSRLILQTCNRTEVKIETKSINNVIGQEGKNTDRKMCVGQNEYTHHVQMSLFSPIVHGSNT